MVAALALAYGGIAQLVAGIWEFRTGNTFGAVAFCSYRRVLDLVLLRRPVRRIERSDRDIQWTRTVPVDVGDLHRLHVHRFAADDGAVALVFLLLAITFIILGIGNSALAGTHSAINGTIKLGGYVGIATAIVAWYASFAAVHELDVRSGAAAGLPARGPRLRARATRRERAVPGKPSQVELIVIKSPHTCGRPGAGEFSPAPWPSRV